jgi:hypothetical protein
MDRDNILGTDYFQKMDALFLNDPTIEIIQPEIKPFPKTFVELVTTEKVSHQLDFEVPDPGRAWEPEESLHGRRSVLR